MEKVLASIVFVHYGMTDARRKLAFESFDSLYESIKHLPVEIIVVDNGGNLDDSKKFLELTEQKKITHYIRNADNLWFGKGRNQAIKISEGEFIAVVDNDLLYKQGWLEQCVDVLRIVGEKKLMATPIKILNCHRKQTRKEEINGKEYIVNLRAGSNCWVMKREQFEDIGEFEDHHYSGTLWCKTYIRKGYAVVVIDNKLIEDCGDRKSVTYGYARHHKSNPKTRDIVIKKQLLNGKEVIYFEGFL